MAKFKVGDRVRVKGEPHMKGQKTGTVEIVSDETPYGIKFDGTDMVHKWYVDSEIEAEEGENDSSSDQGSNDEEMKASSDLANNYGWDAAFQKIGVKTAKF